MAAVLLANDIVLVQVACQDTEQFSLNSFHYKVTAVGGATDADVATYVDSFVAADMKAIINNTALYYGVKVTKIWPAPFTIYQTANTNTGSGTAGATSLPRQVSGFTAYYTGFSGKKQRGRTYWPFPASADDTGDGVPSAGYMTRAALAAQHMFGPISVVVSGRTATLAMHIWHRLTSNSDPVVTRVTRGKWATQRRRGSFARANTAPF